MTRGLGAGRGGVGQFGGDQRDQAGIRRRREKERHRACVPQVRVESAPEPAAVTLAVHRSGRRDSGVTLSMMRYPIAA